MKVLLALMLCALAALGMLVFFGIDGESRVLVRVAPSEAGVSPPTGGREPIEATQHATSPPAAGIQTPAAAIALPPAPPAPASAAQGSPPLLPVQGIAVDQLLDTFTDARSQGRRHDAIDIMAPAGTPVLAVADGTVEKLFDSERGGLTIYQFEPSGRLAYYYAHLQRYAEGLHEGQALRRGQVIGYVGSTGNANPDAPHLHFAIFVLGPERRWWEGTAVNPYPVLRGEAPLP